MPEDLKLSQIGSSPLPPPFRGLHSPGVSNYLRLLFRKSSIKTKLLNIIEVKESLRQVSTYRECDVNFTRALFLQLVPWFSG